MPMVVVVVVEVGVVVIVLGARHSPDSNSRFPAASTVGEALHDNSLTR